MLSDAAIGEVRRLLRETDLSQSEIARRLRISRGTVSAIANRRRLPRGGTAAAQRRVAERFGTAPADPNPRRCPQCGGLVYFPCLACDLRRWIAQQAF